MNMQATNYNVDQAVELYFAHGAAAANPPQQSDEELARMLSQGREGSTIGGYSVQSLTMMSENRSS